MKSRIAVSILSLSVAVLSLLLGEYYGNESVSDDNSSISAAMKIPCDTDVSDRTLSK